MPVDDNHHEEVAFGAIKHSRQSVVQTCDEKIASQLVGAYFTQPKPDSFELKILAIVNQLKPVVQAVQLSWRPCRNSKHRFPTRFPMSQTSEKDSPKQSTVFPQGARIENHYGDSASLRNLTATGCKPHHEQGSSDPPRSRSSQPTSDPTSLNTDQSRFESSRAVRLERLLFRPLDQQIRK
ncbi:hypothetical protein KOR42_33970 [Thalassoglobus neptunius]|uniref:Uncharacterized protein n=1 Tax=Thalassoglobus neptunius TaxID=1938619 RepID=A0A5C5WNL4_9PLAN|nr:hypothetical protein KOR42_33970 [Thalassoglobus neptunius]